MKKIPTLFRRLYFEDGSFMLTQEVTEGMEWVLSRRKKEQGIATVKWDGSCTAIINGEFYKRYDAIGKHFQGNPYGSMIDWLTRHGIDEVKVSRSYEGIRAYLRDNEIEGLVFWKDGEPRCKIKRTDFGFQWPVRSDLKDLPQ